MAQTQINNYSGGDESNRPIYNQSTAAFTVTAAQSGSIFLCDVVRPLAVLPSTAEGLRYTFTADKASIASGNGNTVSPAAADGINGAVVNKHVINTQSTAILGDSITLIGTGTAGTDAWVIESKGGIWAAES